MLGLRLPSSRTPMPEICAALNSHAPTHHDRPHLHLTHTRCESSHQTVTAFTCDACLWLCCAAHRDREGTVPLFWGATPEGHLMFGSRWGLSGGLYVLDRGCFQSVDS